MTSYRDLEVYGRARKLANAIHLLTIRELPKFEFYETGSQIRRSSKSVRSNIVEGYGRRRYKADYIRFLTYAHASADETLDHLDSLWETESLRNESLYSELADQTRTLGRKLNRFIQAVERGHNSRT